MAMVYRPDRTKTGYKTPLLKGKKVQNLGWFFRKARITGIEHFTMTRDETTARHGMSSWLMEVKFDDGTLFMSDFADMSVFKDVMGRQRSLKGVLVNISDNGKDSILELGSKRGSR